MTELFNKVANNKLLFSSKMNLLITILGKNHFLALWNIYLTEYLLLTATVRQKQLPEMFFIKKKVLLIKKKLLLKNIIYYLLKVFLLKTFLLKILQHLQENACVGVPF